MLTDDIRCESREDFIQRASRVFPEDETQAWTRLERALFNRRLAPLIFDRGYAAISDDMLHELRDEIHETVVRLYGTPEAMHYGRGYECVSP